MGDSGRTLLAFKPKVFPLLAFIIPLTVRAVPEILVGPYIVGFDPLGSYIPFLIQLRKGGVDFWHLIAAAPLFNVILMQIISLGMPLTLTFKIMPPLLHGFLALAVYFYAGNALIWSRRKSLFTALLATLYFVALRVSWDLLRNELGLALLFITLTLLHRSDNNLSRYVLSSLTMILMVLANQYVTVTMLLIVAAMVTHALFKNEYKKARDLFMASTPATLLFLLVLYANYEIAPDFSVALAGLPGLTRAESEGWLLLFGFSSYSNMAISMLCLLIYCYLPMLPLAVMGTKLLKNFQIRMWTLWSLLATFCPILWQYRWALMLTYPLAFYVVEALANMKPNRRCLRVSISLGAILMILTVSFMVVPYEMAFPYFHIFPYYVPSSMLQNTVPLSDCPDVVNALSWLEENMRENAVLITHTSFHGWALLTLNADQVIPYGYGNPEKAAENATQLGYQKIYLIWWTEGYGWHGQPTVGPSFEEVYRSGKIAVYIYKG